MIENSPVHNLLLASDLTSRCDRATDRAAQLAKMWNAKLLVVHAINPNDAFHFGKMTQGLPSWRRPDDYRTIMERRVSMDLKLSEIDADVHISEGIPHEVVLKAAIEESSDIVITGMGRDESLARVQFGSTLDSLLKSLQIPIMTARRRVRGPYQHIVVATDFSPASRPALENSIRLFGDAKLTLFHAYVGTYREDDLQANNAWKTLAYQQYKKFIDETALESSAVDRLHPVIEKGQPEVLLCNYVRHEEIDLVVLGTHGRGGLLRTMLGSTAENLLHLLECDTMVVRSK